MLNFEYNGKGYLENSRGVEIFVSIRGCEAKGKVNVPVEWSESDIRNLGIQLQRAVIEHLWDFGTTCSLEDVEASILKLKVGESFPCLDLATEKNNWCFA